MKQVTVQDNDRVSGRNQSATPKRTVRARSGGPRVPEASQEAKRIAASILEVLAGASSPTAAAATLDVSLPRYYLLEQRAIEALVAACEPRTDRTIAPHREIDVLRKQLERAERDATRYQTLLRVAQRTIGLAPLATMAKGKTKGVKAKRTRKPTARALVAARTLRAGDSNAATPTEPTPPHIDHVSSALNNQPAVETPRTSASDNVT